jgi:hypothetical protein
MNAIARNGNGMKASDPASQAAASVRVAGRSRSETSTEAATNESVSSGPATTTSKTIAPAWLRLIAARSISPTGIPSTSERQNLPP